MREEEEEAVDHSPAAGDEIKVSAATFFQKCSEKPADKDRKIKKRYHLETQGAALSIVSDIYFCDCGEVSLKIGGDN